MKVSEFIERLNQLRETVGDVEVLISSNDSETDYERAGVESLNATPTENADGGVRWCSRRDGNSECHVVVY